MTTPPQPTRAPATHRHRWIGVDFYLADGRPFVRASCECGAERSYRAWNVEWTPDAEELTGSDPAA